MKGPTKETSSPYSGKKNSSLFEAHRQRRSQLFTPSPFQDRQQTFLTQEVEDTYGRRSNETRTNTLETPDKRDEKSSLLPLIAASSSVERYGRKVKPGLTLSGHKLGRKDSISQADLTDSTLCDQLLIVDQRARTKQPVSYSRNRTLSSQESDGRSQSH